MLLSQLEYDKLTKMELLCNFYGAVPEDTHPTGEPPVEGEPIDEEDEDCEDEDEDDEDAE